jgi:hypothetical protein
VYKSWYFELTLILLTCRIWRAPKNASNWQMEFNLAFKGLNRNTLVAVNGHLHPLRESVVYVRAVDVGVPATVIS